jgi:hypothetical protein
MEVTHKDDHVTHAVVGGSEKIDYTIADGGFFMQMLSASLYKDQKLAVIRETLCNADDAHKMVGQTRPFVVTLTSEKLIIRDFGPGIPHEKIGPVYGTYGGSTKQNDDGQTGGFGLGCKAPFAYTDNFQVTSYCNGTKTVYRMSKSDSEVGGKPSIVKIVSVPTQETGLEVSINIARSIDVHQFSSRITQVLANGEMNAIFNGNQARVLPFSKMEKGYLLTAERPLDNTTGYVYVRYGAVIYPIEENDYFRFEHRAAHQTVSRLGRDEGTDFYLILQAEPGSLSLTPSREGLTITEKTNETVKGLLDHFNRVFDRDFESEAKMIFADALKASANDVEMLMALPTEMKLQKKYIERPMDSEGNYYIVNPTTLARWSLLHKYPGERDDIFALNDIRQRLRYLIAAPEYTGDRGLLRSLYSALKNGKRRTAGNMAFEEYRKRVINPVLIAMHGNKLLNKSDLMLAIPFNGWTEGRSYYRNDRIYLRGASHCHVPYAGHLFRMQRRVIVLTHSHDGFDDKIRYANQEERDATPGFHKLEKGNDRLFGALVYQVGRAKAKVDAAREVLSKVKGYTFVDLTKVIEYREPKVRVAKSVVKKTGFPSLTGVKVTDGRSDAKYYDWQMMSSTEDRVENPIGYVELYGKTHHKGRDHVCGVSSAAKASLIEKFYGDRVAVVMNESQKNILHKKGVLRESIWIPKQVQKELSDPSLLAALPGTLRVVTRWLSEQEVDIDFVRMILRTPALCEALKVAPLTQLTSEQSNTMTMLKEFREEYQELGNADIVAKIDAMEPPAKLQKFVKGLASNKMLSLIDTAAMRVVFDGEDADLKAKAIKLIKQVIKG